MLIKNVDINVEEMDISTIPYRDDFVRLISYICRNENNVCACYGVNDVQLPSVIGSSGSDFESRSLNKKYKKIVDNAYSGDMYSNLDRLLSDDRLWYCPPLKVTVLFYKGKVYKEV